MKNLRNEKTIVVKDRPILVYKALDRNNSIYLYAVDLMDSTIGDKWKTKDIDPISGKKMKVSFTVTYRDNDKCIVLFKLKKKKHNKETKLYQIEFRGDMNEEDYVFA